MISGTLITISRTKAREEREVRLVLAGRSMHRTQDWWPDGCSTDTDLHQSLQYETHCVPTLFSGASNFYISMGFLILGISMALLYPNITQIVSSCASFYQ